MTRVIMVLLVLAGSPAAAGAQLPSSFASEAHPPLLHLRATLPARVSWSTSDVALAGAFAFALAIDAAQTRSLAARGWTGYRETNPVLGPRPSVGQVNTYTVVAGLAVLGAAAVVPRRVRPWLLGAALVVETFTIAGSVRQGVAVKFP